VADGDAGLQPAKLHFPGAVKGIGASFETAKIGRHRY
jgi:hypothetical protein